MGVTLVLGPGAYAQQVDVFLDDSGAHGNIVMGPDGSLYVSDYAGTNGFNGRTVVKIDIDGTTSVFARGLAGPTGLAFAADGSTYIANYNRGDITKIAADGTPSTFAAGLNGPSGITLDSEGNLVVVNGGFPMPGNHPISKIDPSGTISTFATNDLFNGLDGITQDADGNFYVTNYNDGRILKVTADGTASLFAELPNVGPGSGGWITFANNRLYVTASSTNQIYEVALDGTLTVLAGTGALGTANGAALDASFQFPNGIAASVTGDTLFVTEFPPTIVPKRIRMITGVRAAATHTEVKTQPVQLTLDQNYPNPFNPSTTIAYTLRAAAHVTLDVYDQMGQRVDRLVGRQQGPGAYAVTFDASNLASGVYYYRLQAGPHRQTKAMSVLK